MKTILLLLSIVWSYAAAVAGLPEWATAFTTSPLLGIHNRYDRQLLDWVQIECPRSADRTILRSRLVFLVGGEGAYADFDYPIHYQRESLKSVSAYSVSPVGKAKALGKDHLSHRLARGDKLYSDQKIAQWSLQNIDVGSIVCVEYTVEEDHLIGCGRFYLQDPRWDVDSTIIDCALPPEWSVRFTPEAVMKNQLTIGERTIHAGAMIRWEERPFQGNFALSAAQVAYEIFRNRDAKLETSWPNVSMDIARKWGKLKDGIGKLKYVPEQPPALDSLLHRFEHDFRYVAIELGEGTVIPRLPQDVLKAKYGDCKDLSFFLRSALTEVGMEVYPVLVRMPWSDPFLPDYPYPYQFSHCITAIVRDTDTLYYDPTATGFDLGVLPPPDRNAYALWIKEAHH